MKKIILFGASGGIGREIEKLLKCNNILITPTRKEVDFLKENHYNDVSNILSTESPDVIINSVGYRGNNYETHYKMMNTNFGSNWSIVRHYMLNPPNKPIKICMLGSIAYSEGKEEYIIYAASKMAVYSLWQGATKYFKNTNVTINLINPQRTKTKMTKQKMHLIYHEPEDVAKVVYDYVIHKNGSNLVDMEFKV